MNQIYDPKIYRYTMRVKCYDGKIRSFEREAVFTSPKVFYAKLADWTGPNGPNGGTYKYYETTRQKLWNYINTPRPILNKGTLVWYDPTINDFLIKE